MAITTGILLFDDVEELDFVGRKAHVREVDCDYYTTAITYTKVTILDRFAEDAAELELAALEAKRAGADARAVEQVVDQARHAMGRGADLGDVAHAVGVEPFGRILDEGLAERRDRAQRCAQIV